MSLSLRVQHRGQVPLAAYSEALAELRELDPEAELSCEPGTPGKIIIGIGADERLKGKQALARMMEIGWRLIGTAILT